jgi:uncharacterized membrane protein YcaP (DUF421 family)
MKSAWTIDWHSIFVPSGSLVELMVRGSIMYLLILAAFRVFRRQAGSLAVSDLLVVVLVADAAQNGMAGEYRSLTEGVVLVATIFAWDYAVDWAAYRWRAVHRLVYPAPLPLVTDGKIQRRNLRSELMTVEELMAQVRQQGVDDISQIKTCCLESDGKLSLVKKQEDQ